jgi:alpha-D-ribose 1-methylphosphonate 5-triphosphate synthase subunit PhnG
LSLSVISTLATELDNCMTTDDLNEKTKARKHWLAVLARASRADLETAWADSASSADDASIAHLRAAETGMVMLRGRVGGTGDAFNLGEASVTRCALRLGNGPLGVGYTLGRDKRKAELIAVFDAMLQNSARTAHIMQRVVEPMAKAQAAAHTAQSLSVATSKVEFFTFVRGAA